MFYLHVMNLANFESAVKNGRAHVLNEPFDNKVLNGSHMTNVEQP
jgi:hypothetical protein